MTIGIIGAGNIGQAFAKHAARAGYDIIISNSRGADSLKELAGTLGANVKAGSIEDTAGAEILFLSVPWQNIEKVIDHIPSWEGKILIDATNPIITTDFSVAELDGLPSSVVVASKIPGAKLVKAFNTFTPALLGSEPNRAEGKRVIFYSGNDPEAKKTVSQLISDLGFAGVDLGKLEEGGKLQQYPGGSLPGLNLVLLNEE